MGNIYIYKWDKKSLGGQMASFSIDNFKTPC